VLSAVDQHVGRHIIDNVLGPKGLLAGKTRILATNSIPVLMEAHFIVLLREGRIFERGTYEQLMAMKGEISNLIKTASKESQEAEEDEETPPDSASSPYSEGTAYEPESPEDPEEMNEAGENIAALEPIKPSGGNAGGENRRDAAAAGGPKAAARIRRNTNITLRRASTLSFRGPRGKITTDEEDQKGGANGKANGAGRPANKSRQEAEHLEQGKVKWDVYKEYARASNLVAVGIYLVMMIGSQTSGIGKSPTLVSFVFPAFESTCPTSPFENEMHTSLRIDNQQDRANLSCGLVKHIVSCQAHSPSAIFPQNLQR
jgi:hypothetical protein